MVTFTEIEGLSLNRSDGPYLFVLRSNRIGDAWLTMVLTFKKDLRVP